MVEWVKACAAKPNNLSSIPSTHTVGELQFPEAGLGLPDTECSICMPTPPPHTINE